MLFFFCAAIAFTLFVIAVSPRSFTSESKLFIRVGRESVGLDPTATTGQTIMLQKTQADEVNSALQILGSREVLRRVVERLGAERILSDTPPKGSSDSVESAPTWITRLADAKAAVRGWMKDRMRELRLSDPGTAEDLAIRQLEGIKTTAAKDSTVITLSYSAASPQLAHDVIEALTNVFLEEHVRLNVSEGSLKFFSEQAAKLQKELSGAQAELRDRKNEFQVTSLESRRAVFAEQMKDVSLQALNTQRELAFSGAEIEDLTKAIKALAPELVTDRTTGFANEAKDQMREKLYELEIEESKLRSRFKAEHPLLIQVEKQRKEAQAILTGLPDNRTQTKAELNPNQRLLEVELVQAKAKNEALRARQAAVLKQQDEMNKEMQSLNEHEVQLAQLERNVQLLDGKYRMHVEKLEQARVNEAMGREQLSNVKIAQPATLVGKPTSPKKSLLLAFGVAVALAGSLGWTFLAEVFDSTLRTTAQVESELGLPVLASFPYRRRRRRRSKARKTQNIGGPNRYSALVGELLRGSSNGNGNGNGKPHSTAVGIVGCETTDARSRVATGLALQAATSSAAPVLLIDADERNRRVARRFHINGSPGWRELLAGNADAQTAVRKEKNGRLSVMGPGTDNGHESPDKSNGAAAVLDEIKARYGMVVVDLPSATVLERAASPGWLDEMVLVVEAERTRIRSAKRAKEILERAGIRLRGVVLANRREHIPRWLYQRL